MYLLVPVSVCMCARGCVQVSVWYVLPLTLLIYYFFASSLSHLTTPPPADVKSLDWHPYKRISCVGGGGGGGGGDLRAVLSACKMCPYGAHPHLAVRP